MTAPAAVTPEPLEGMIARAEGADWALVALGIPRCPACMLLPASLGALAGARPNLTIGLSLFQRPEDWALRERVLWPRGIHVSRSSVPMLVLLHHGSVTATKPGGAPAFMLDRWLSEFMGPAQHPLAAETTADEVATLDSFAARRAQQTAVKGRETLGEARDAQPLGGSAKSQL